VKTPRKCGCRQVQHGPLLYQRKTCAWHTVLNWLAKLFKGKVEYE
jgi:hypothetical protein